MSEEIKQPEEITDVPLPEPPKVLSESDLKDVVGGVMEATITHRKAGKGQQEFLVVPTPPAK